MKSGSSFKASFRDVNSLANLPETFLMGPPNTRKLLDLKVKLESTSRFQRPTLKF